MKKQTAVEFIIKHLSETGVEFYKYHDDIINQAKAMEKEQMDNKVIHFAEWLTEKHTLTLMEFYKHFEQQYYEETYEKTN